jgi:hypothetical protein
MRPTLASITVLLSAFPATAQTVDLSKWSVEHINTVSNGTWTVNAPRFHTSFAVSTINDCSVLYSDVLMPAIDFRLSVDPAAGDDDIIGFVLGFNPGDGSNPNADYLVVDWKAITQAYGNWGTAQAGLALSRVTGVPTPGTGGAPIDLWSHTGVVQELARGVTYGRTGWAYGTKYYFRVLATPSSVDIWVNGQREFQVTGTFKTGRFGCYSLSQGGMEFQFPVQASFKSFGNGCRGSAGTPYLFAPELPMSGENFPVVIANLPPTAGILLALGASNSTWSGIPLPFDLGPIGGTGCNLYTSVQVLLPVANFNGTGFVNIQVTELLPVLARLFVQGLAFDASANALGMVFSNAGEATIGIR